MRRLLSLVLALVAALGMLLAAPAAADDGPIGDGVEVVCDVGTGVGGVIVDVITGEDLCDKIGDAVEGKIKKEWEAVWDSILGDVVKSGEDVAAWAIKKTLTVALQGPSLDLEATGLFGKDATSNLAGMIVWLGWVIATFGLMWQLGKMAVTGQLKYAGQALVGWVQNALLTGIGLTFVVLLLKLGDAMTSGLVDATFADDGKAYERIVSVMMPNGIANPITLGGVVLVLLLVGLIQMALIFLRTSAIPIQCMLLPIAGAGRVGGEATRQWAPKLITSILVVIAYKPMLAIIICVGFAEFGHSQTLAEWLRGLATLLLGVIAPGPLMKLFAPLGAEIGGGLAAGGAMGAAAAVSSRIGGDESGSSGGGDGAEPTDAVQHAQYVEQQMGSQKQGQGGGGQESRGDAVAQAARNKGTEGGSVPAQGAAGAEAGSGGASSSAGGAAAAAGGAIAIAVLDGVNDAVQKGASEIGDGGKQ